MTTSDSREALIECLVAGQFVAADALPVALRGDPAIARLLRFSRVFEVLRGGDQMSAALPGVGAAGERLGPYRLVRPLGQGGMGEVWLGERADGAVELRVALKRVRADLPDFSARLEAERRILARLDHPNIARFLDAGVDALDRPWLALEYVEGVAVTEWCRQARPDIEARLRLLLKICAALEHAHRHLVVHRDLKPSNVLVTAAGEPKLLDFGIAKLLDASAGEETQGGLTPAYAAPEQLRGEPVSTATDVYALGLLMFRLLAGTRPATRENATPLALLAALEAEESQRPSARAATTSEPLPYPATRLRGDLDAIVARAMRAAPEARYASVRELAQDIENVLSARPVRARDPGWAYRVSRFLRRNWKSASVTALVVAALVVASTVTLLQSRRAESEALAARAELARSERLSGFLVSLFRENDPQRRASAEPRAPRDVLADAMRRVEAELSDDVRIRAELLLVLARAQLNLGDFVAARDGVERAATAIAIGGASVAPRLIAEVDALRGELALHALDHDQARRHYTTALDTLRNAYGEDSVELARVQVEYARALLHAGRFREARPAAESAAAALVAALGPNATESLYARFVLGQTLEQMREDGAALATLESLAQDYELRFGVEDVRLANVLQTLGEVHRRQGDFDSARVALERAVQIARLRFGERHSQLAQTYSKLAATEINARRFDAALLALDRAEAALPPHDQNARAQILASRGRLHLEQSQGALAEPDLREALRLRRDQGGEQNAIAWYTQAELALALAQQGRDRDALRLGVAARTGLGQALGEQAYQNALVADRLGQVHALAGRWTEAAAEFQVGLRLAEKTYGEDGAQVPTYALKLLDAQARVPALKAAGRALAESLEQRWSARPALGPEREQLRRLRARLGE